MTPYNSADAVVRRLALLLHTITGYEFDSNEYTIDWLMRDNCGHVVVSGSTQRAIAGRHELATYVEHDMLLAVLSVQNSRLLQSLWRLTPNERNLIAVSDYAKITAMQNFGGSAFIGVMQNLNSDEWPLVQAVCKILNSELFSGS